MLGNLLIVLISLIFGVRTHPATCNIIAKEDLFKGIREQIVPNAWNQLENPTIPDHEQKGGHHLTKWSLSINGCGSTISQLDQNSIQILLSQASNTLTLQIDNVSVSAHCNAHVKTKILRTSGSVSASMQFSRIAVTLRPSYFERDDGLRAPDFEVVSTAVEVHDLHLHIDIHRVPGFIDKLISGIVKDIWGSKMKTKLKESFDKSVQRELERIRTTTKLQNEIDDTGLQLVYDLATTPTIHDSWIQIPVDCTVYPSKSQTITRPDVYSVSPLPSLDTTLNSEIHLSDYIVNSFLWAAAMKPYAIQVNNEFLKLKNIERFMTTRYFAKIIPEFGQFDDLPLEGLLYLSQENLPKATIEQDLLNIDVELMFEMFFADHKERGIMFELDGNVQAKMSASPGDSESMMLVYGEIKELKLASCKLVSSTIGQLQLDDFTTILSGFLALAKNAANSKILNTPYPISKKAMRLVEVNQGSVNLGAGYGTIGLNIEPQP